MKSISANSAVWSAETTEAPEKQGLLNYLRSELNNYEIDLSIEVIEGEINRYAYTPREKYEKLREKNPLLDSLRKEFDLDV